MFKVTIEWLDGVTRTLLVTSCVAGEQYIEAGSMNIPVSVIRWFESTPVTEEQIEQLTAAAAQAEEEAEEEE